MKRFTDTEKWRDPWMLSLEPRLRFLWIWLCDRCDNAGVVDIAWPLAVVEIGMEVSEADMVKLGDRVQRLENGKWHLPKFIHFQFGELSSESRVHQSVIKLMRQHSLRIGYGMLSHSTKDKEKDQDKNKDQNKDKVKANLTGSKLSK